LVPKSENEDKEGKYLDIVDHSDKYLIIISPNRKRFVLELGVGMLRRGRQGFDYATS
jgi:hypothetical protein